ncbi:hypothetical protein AVEN_29719-1 [Araneus ventricosus]|uniref:Uncharacterized protein n=1 Tax=Araneus ventricosus TaxID=182803 RepID=A0A4Y2UYT5_ARAVE|nr:hypothetical protein AVEN_29719-1 [Araneus ventricosus]
MGCTPYKGTYDRIRTFEPRSEEGNENEAGAYQLQSSAAYEQKDMCTSTCDLTCKRSNSRWIFSGIEIRSLPLRPLALNLTTAPCLSKRLSGKALEILNKTSPWCSGGEDWCMVLA